jgi:hypothetical protein
MPALCTTCGTTVTCPSSSSCSVTCTEDCSFCQVSCGLSLKSVEFVEKAPWLLKTGRVKFAGSNLKRALLAEYLGRLLGTTLTPMTESAEPINVSEFTGTVEELLDHLELRPEGDLRR